MSLLSKLLEQRRRRRTSDAFDSPVRRTFRSLERRIKFYLSSPLGAIVRPPRFSKRLDPAEVKSVLILRYDALGDAVLTTPVWRSIKKYAPHIRVGVAGSHRNKQLLLADPDIDDVFIVSRAINAETIRELWRARKTKWDVVLNLFFHDKTRAAIFSKIMSPGAITSTVVRDHHEKYQRIYSIVGDRPPLHPGTQMLLQNLMVLEQTIAIPLTEEDRQPTLYVDKIAEADFLTELELVEGKSLEYVLINTDASQSYKEWGLDNSLALSREISAVGRQVFWTCAPAMKPKVEEFLAKAGEHQVQLLHTPSVQHLAAAVLHSTLVVSPDTSVIHFAAAFKKPVVGFYLDQTEFMPFKIPSRVLYPPTGNMAKNVPVDEVFKAVKELLQDATSTT